MLSRLHVFGDRDGELVLQELWRVVVDVDDVDRDEAGGRQGGTPPVNGSARSTSVFKACNARSYFDK